MARDDEAPFSDEFENELWQGMIEQRPEMLGDRMLETLFHDSFFAQDVSSDIRALERDAFAHYIYDEYDLSIDDAIDWDAWREWYESA